MGVHGLWKLLEPSGNMVPLESLAGKTIAVDVSIWLHQAIKGMHDAYGAPVETAHLVILFHRLCKLLFYKIKPVFVFDGGIPALKHQTMAARRQNTSVAKSEVLKVREKLIKNLLKHEAVRQVLSNETASAALGLNSFALPGPSVEEDLYKLPPIAADYADNTSSEDMEDEEMEEEGEGDKHLRNIYSVDVTKEEFLKLPPEIRHDILTELIETRKQSSWKFLDAMPSDSDNFSNFQMDRLLKRKAVQTSLEQAGKEMGGRAMSLKELESMLSEKGVIEKTLLPGRRIAQDNVTRYMLVKKDMDEVITKKGDGETKFDVMDHLDEVEWSSESDTDVILEKSRKTRELKNLDNKLKTKMVLTKPVDKEVADILNILEDDVESETETQALEIPNQFPVQDTSKTEKKEQSDVIDDNISDTPNNETESEKEMVNLDMKTPEVFEKDTLAEEITEKIFEVENYKGKDEDTCNVASDSNEKNSEEISVVLKVESESKEASEVKIFQGEKEKQEKNGSEILVESDSTETQIFKTETSENVEMKEKDNLKLLEVQEVEETKQIETSKAEIDVPVRKEKSESSSDSEGDFVSINVPNASDEPNLLVKPEMPKSPTKDLKESKESQSLLITVVPTEMNVGDDIFADVFQPSSESNVIQKTSENFNEETIKDVNEFGKEMTSEELKDLKRSLEEKQFDLMMEKGKQERQALNPTEQMYEDAQELLRLFGIPFVVAPMEAEAQCACLDNLGLTEGTITDDSDIWLFGGRVVYKNFFNQKKHVLEYRAANIQKCFKLKREDLIRMAMLVGSDYTTGLNGIGPVTALEILASFPSSGENLFDGLEKFRDWFNGRNTTTSPRTSLKRKIRNTIISPGFPNKAVANAYLFPHVDDSKEPFSWAKPNLELIRKYVKGKIGWSPEKCSSLLLPVLKKMEESKSQSVMERYLHGAPNTVGTLSKRVENAIKKLEGKDEEEGEKEEVCTNKKRKAKKEGGEVQRKKRGRKKNNVEEEEKLEEGCAPKMAVQPVVTLPQPQQEQRQQSSSTKSKDSLIKEKLHREEKIPQREKAQKLLDDRKKEAIEIFRTFKRKKKKVKVYAKKEANLSESSDDD